MGRGDPLRADPQLREARVAQPARLPGALLSAEPLWPAAAGRSHRDVYALGQISLDRVWRVAAGAEPEPAAAPAGLPEHPGGQAATVALGLARLGLRVAYAGAVGADAAAEAALLALRYAGVDLADVQQCRPGRTRAALVTVDAGSGERVVRPERDPRVRLDPAALDPQRIAGARALYVDVEDVEASLRAAQIANAAGVPVVLDAERDGPVLERLLRHVDFPIVPRSFAESFCDGSVRGGLEALARLARRLAVVTLGADGALAQARDGDRQVESPGLAVAARDTTGAGDAFRVGFIWALLEGGSLERVLRVANAVGALNCREVGAQTALPDRETLEAFLARGAGRTGEEAR